MNARKTFSFQKNAGYALIIIVAGVIAFSTHQKTVYDRHTALETYRKSSEIDSTNVANKFSETFKQIYQGLRTISFLPSVQNVDRHGTNLDQNAHAAIEQIYKNMASNVDVSEIYIVPADLDPEKIDPVTGELEIPILMYDGADLSQDTVSDTPNKNLITTIAAAEQAEEVEIYEYRLLHEHMAYFKANYNEKSKIDGLNLPMITGASVLTCDNAEFEKTKKDVDRTGIVLSVPFYDLTGIFKGTITAIIRNNVFKALLPDDKFVLTNYDYNYFIAAENAPLDILKNAYLTAHQKDSSVLFSTLVPIKTTDPRSAWQLWARYPDENFYTGRDIVEIELFSYIGYGVAILFALIGCGINRLIQRNFNLMQKQKKDLDNKLAEQIAEIDRLAKEEEKNRQQSENDRKVEMLILADKFDDRTKSAVKALSEAAMTMRAAAQELNGSSQQTAHASIIVAGAANEADANVQTVAAATEELSASSKEISQQVSSVAQRTSQAAKEAENTSKTVSDLDKYAQSVGEVVDAIREIAEQTNLLALNATIEAARAGEAGKGFAVVADEVKKLAIETSTKTDEINERVVNIQEAIRKSVDAVNRIIANVTQIDQATASVSDAVEEQTTATSEIGRSVSEASKGTQEVSRTIQGVSLNATETGQSAEMVLKTAEDLAEISKDLNDQISQFLNEIRHS